jgi:hypothetical protein
MFIQYICVCVKLEIFNLGRKMEEESARNLIFGDIKTRASGKEIFEKWIATGAIKKAATFFSTEECMLTPATARKRAIRYLLHSVEDAWQIILKINPDARRDDFEKGVMTYAVKNFIRPGAFLEWVKRNPWTEKYKKEYSEYYGIRFLS